MTTNRRNFGALNKKQIQPHAYTKIYRIGAQHEAHSLKSTAPRGNAAIQPAAILRHRNAVSGFGRNYMEMRGLEPLTFCMPCKRSSQVSYTPAYSIL